MEQLLSDEHYMRVALREAQEALEVDEVPVGAVIVSQDEIIAKGRNSVQLLRDITAHAEILAITAASQNLMSKYLLDCSLYVTLEPCPMCAGALKWSQISRIVYGASDDKAGFMQFGKKMLHPKTKLEFGVLHDECAELLKSFFALKRMA